MLTGKSLDKAHRDFQLEIVKMLPFVGPEVAASEIELAVDHGGKDSQTMVRVDPDLRVKSEAQPVVVAVPVGRKRTA